MLINKIQSNKQKHLILKKKNVKRNYKSHRLTIMNSSSPKIKFLQVKGQINNKIYPKQ